jgi:hypothetical protein
LHANAVLSEEVFDYSVLFAEIADAYFEREMYAEAKPIYELLGGDPAVCQILSSQGFLSNYADYRPVLTTFFFKQQHA